MVCEVCNAEDHDCDADGKCHSKFSKEIAKKKVDKAKEQEEEIERNMEEIRKMDVEIAKLHNAVDQSLGKKDLQSLEGDGRGEVNVVDNQGCKVMTVTQLPHGRMLRVEHALPDV